MAQHVANAAGTPVGLWAGKQGPSWLLPLSSSLLVPCMAAHEGLHQAFMKEVKKSKEIILSW